MKKLLKVACLSLFVGGLLIGTTSCSKKTGCPINEKAGVKADKKTGELPTRRGKSKLFPN